MSRSVHLSDTCMYDAACLVLAEVAMVLLYWKVSSYGTAATELLYAFILHLTMLAIFIITRVHYWVEHCSVSGSISGLV